MPKGITVNHHTGDAYYSSSYEEDNTNSEAESAPERGDAKPTTLSRTMPRDRKDAPVRPHSYENYDLTSGPTFPLTRYSPPRIPSSPPPADQTERTQKKKQLDNRRESQTSEESSEDEEDDEDEEDEDDWDYIVDEIMPSSSVARPAPVQITSCYLSQKMDMTMHLQLEVTDDLSAGLEEFSKLCRLGRFNVAKRFFMENLHEHDRNPYVRLHYAQMLLDSGDFKGINTLDKSLELQSHPALQRNWSAIIEAADLHTISTFKLGAYQKKTKDGLTWCGRREQLDSASTELQYAWTLLQNLGYLMRFEGEHEGDLRTQDYLMKAKDSLRFDDLIQNHRLWDCRDMLSSLVKLDPMLRIVSQLFRAPTAHDLHIQISTQWLTQPQDESSSLACIDMLQALLMAPSWHPEHAIQLDDTVTAMMSSLLKQNRGLMASRQYVRWILASVQSQMRHETTHPPHYAGFFLPTSDRYQPSIYVPLQSETPGSLPFVQRADLTSSLLTALDVARALADHTLEVSCLEVLIVYSINSREMCDQLIQLQRETQGDLQGCLQTCLMKYRYCTDQSSQIKLRKEILTLGWSDNYPTMLFWARAMILKALSRSVDETFYYLAHASSLALHEKLPTRYMNFMELARSHMSLINPAWAEYWQLHQIHEGVSSESYKGPGEPPLRTAHHAQPSGYSKPPNQPRIMPWKPTADDSTQSTPQKVDAASTHGLDGVSSRETPTNTKESASSKNLWPQQSNSDGNITIVHRPRRRRRSSPQNPFSNKFTHASLVSGHKHSEGNRPNIIREASRGQQSEHISDQRLSSQREVQNGNPNTSIVVPAQGRGSKSDHASDHDDKEASHRDRLSPNNARMPARKVVTIQEPPPPFTRSKSESGAVSSADAKRSRAREDSVYEGSAKDDISLEEFGGPNGQTTANEKHNQPDYGEPEGTSISRRATVEFVVEE